MTKEMRFFIYLLENFAAHNGETADVTYRRLESANLIDHVLGMYEYYHTEAIENAYDDLTARLCPPQKGAAA